MNELRKFLPKNRVTHKGVIFVPDLFICVLAFFYANLLLNDFKVIYFGSRSLWQGILAVVLASSACLYIFKTYQGIIRFSEFHEAVRGISAVFASFVMLVSINIFLFFAGQVSFIPYSVLFIYFLTASSVICGYRVLLKTLYKGGMNEAKSVNVLIYGGSAGGSLIIDGNNSRSAAMLGNQGNPEPDTIRFFDILIALAGIILMSPVLIVIGLLIKFSSKGPVIFRQRRVGINNTHFVLYKFRTMYHHDSKEERLTVGSRDKRITRVGYYLRKFKMDELPQLYNVIKGDMSIVGPRPELRKFVELYSPEQKDILLMRPGITDYASIFFRNEAEILAKQDHPEEYYIKEIMPAKIVLNRQYANRRTTGNYFMIIFKTSLSIMSRPFSNMH